MLELLIAIQTVLLTWDEVPNVNGYKVYAGTSPGRYERVSDVGKVGSATLPDLPDDFDYFAVTSYNATGESAKSAEVSLAPAAPVPTPSPTPTATPTPIATPTCDAAECDQVKSNYHHCETHNFQMWNAWQDAERAKAAAIAAQLKAEKELAKCKDKYPKGCK